MWLMVGIDGANIGRRKPERRPVTEAVDRPQADQDQSQEQDRP
jgi:hypothetical protein